MRWQDLISESPDLPGTEEIKQHIIPALSTESWNMCVHPVVLHHFLSNQTDPNICFENGYRWRLLHVIICSFNQLKTNYLLSVKLTLVWDFAFSVAFSAILQSKIHIFFLFLHYSIFFICVSGFSYKTCLIKSVKKNQALSESVLVAVL